MVDWMIEIDVIIPSKTNDETAPMLFYCMNTLRLAEDDIHFNIIVIESDRDMPLGQNATIKFDLPKFNYNHALNQGIAIAKNEWVILANNDLLFTKNFMTEIINVNELHPEIKSFSPWNAMYSWHQRIFPTAEAIMEGYRIGHEMAGWCIVAKRSIFDTIALNESVEFWFSDNVYADKLQRYNIRHALVRDSIVNHLVSQTHSVTESEAQDSYRKYLATLG